jgi:hypothetical protein
VTLLLADRWRVTAERGLALALGLAVFLLFGTRPEAPLALAALAVVWGAPAGPGAAALPTLARSAVWGLPAVPLVGWIVWFSLSSAAERVGATAQEPLVALAVLAPVLVSAWAARSRAGLAVLVIGFVAFVGFGVTGTYYSREPAQDTPEAGVHALNLVLGDPSLFPTGFLLLAGAGLAAVLRGEPHGKAALPVAIALLYSATVAQFETGNRIFTTWRTELPALQMALLLVGSAAHVVSAGLAAPRARVARALLWLAPFAALALFARPAVTLLQDRHFTPQREHQFVWDSAHLAESDPIALYVDDSIEIEPGATWVEVFKPYLPLRIWALVGHPVEVLGTSALLADPDLAERREVLLYIGSDAYRTPNRAGVVGSVTAIRERFDLVPLAEREIVHRQVNADYLREYRIREELIRLGFYRVVPRGGARPE